MPPHVWLPSPDNLEKTMKTLELQLEEACSANQVNFLIFELQIQDSMIKSKLQNVTLVKCSPQPRLSKKCFRSSMAQRTPSPTQTIHVDEDQKLSQISNICYFSNCDMVQGILRSSEEERNESYPGKLASKKTQKSCCSHHREEKSCLHHRKRSNI